MQHHDSIEVENQNIILHQQERLQIQQQVTDQIEYAETLLKIGNGQFKSSEDNSESVDFIYIV